VGKEQTSLNQTPLLILENSQIELLAVDAYDIELLREVDVGKFHLSQEDEV
jgi:hypothetical protein